MNINDYKGLNIADRLEGYAKECYICSWKWMEEAWGNNVEFERLSEQILLCDETRSYLYDTTPEVKYVRGSRPVLEEISDSLTKDCKTDREKVLAFVVYIRELYRQNAHKGYIDFFYGGTEEELIKKREWCCERVARIMVGLCEIAGIPARIVFHIAAGHLTNEVFFEGKWAYIDPRFGMFCVDEDDKFMSVDEIVKNREVIFNQPEWVVGYQADCCGVDYRQHRNYHFCLSPNEIQCIGEYSLMDADKYHFDWMRPNNGEGETHKRYNETGLMTLIR